MADIMTADMNDGFWITNGSNVGFHTQTTSDAHPEKEGVVYHWDFKEDGSLVCTAISVYEADDMIHFDSYPESKWYE